MKGKNEGAKPLIRKLVTKGYSANRIQKELQKRKMGIRRKRLLAYVRQVKGVEKKPTPEKYVPKKYREVRKSEIGFIPRESRSFWRRKPRVYMRLGKRIAVYGTVWGMSRRVEMYGTSRELYEAMLGVSQHPPKERFLVCDARDIIDNPFEYLDLGETWDGHPEVES